MRKIIITTESGSDVPEELAEALDIRVIPMHVIIGDTDYADGSIPVDKVFEYFETTKKVPSTSAVNIDEYVNYFKQLQSDYPNCYIYNFAYSSLASSTYQNAIASIKELTDVDVIDTRQVSGGCTAHIVSCIELIRKMCGNDELLVPDDFDFTGLFNQMQSLAGKAVCHFIPNTLEYLKAGGRVSNAAYLGATVLNLKPLIEMIDGKLVATKKYRGSIIRWVDKFFEDFTNKYELNKDCLYLMYGKGLPNEVLNKMAELSDKLGFKKHVYVMTGCVISCHGGKGAIGLAGMLK